MPGSGWKVKQVAATSKLTGAGILGLKPAEPRTLEATKSFAKALQLVVANADLAKAHPIKANVVENP